MRDFRFPKMPRFCSAYLHPDSPFSRVAGATPEIEELYLEWCRCHDNWDWVVSPRGRYVDYRLDCFERRYGA